MKKNILTILLLTSCSTSQQNGVITKFFDGDGKQVSENKWNESGVGVVETMNDGVKVKNTYRNFSLDGESIKKFPMSSTTQFCEMYSRGKLIKSTEYYKNSSPKSEKTFSQSNGKSYKDIKKWYICGIPKSEETYVVDGDNEILTLGRYFSYENILEASVTNGEGLRVERDENGRFLYEEKIINGVIAEKIYYWTNRVPKEFIPYNFNGQIHGQKKAFDYNGAPLSIETWVDGEQEGVMYMYDNGIKVSEVMFRKGLKDGVEIKFSDNLMVEKSHWKRGMKHGPSCLYHGKGVVCEWFLHGKRVSKARYKLHCNKK